jgi:hypothetical protein
LRTPQRRSRCLQTGMHLAPGEEFLVRGQHGIDELIQYVFSAFIAERGVGV